MGPSDGSSSTTGELWCFQCGAMYEAGVVHCIECGVGLVEVPPTDVHDVGDLDEEQLAYEFHDWSFESRRMLDQLLTGRSILHAWQGASMIVRADDEDAVDELVDQVEVATLPTLDPDVDHTVYEMEGWTAEQQTVLSNRLGSRGIPHEFDANGDLVVHADSEDQIDEIFDEIEAEAADGTLTADGTTDLDGIADATGLDVNDLLSKVFTAADRLRRNARDSNGVLGLLDHAPMLARVPTPFGFERPDWQNIVDEAVALQVLLEADDSEDADISEHAQRVRDRLFLLI